MTFLRCLKYLKKVYHQINNKMIDLFLCGNKEHAINLFTKTSNQEKALMLKRLFKVLKPFIKSLNEQLLIKGFKTLFML